MNFNNQNPFNRQGVNDGMSVHQGLNNPVSRIRALSSEPGNKVQALSHLARFKDQMTPQEYQEVLSDIKAMKSDYGNYVNDVNCSNQQFEPKDYKANVDILKNIERNRW